VFRNEHLESSSFKISKGGGYYKFPFIGIGMAYNPLSYFLSVVFSKKGYWKPRRITFDHYAAIDYKWKRDDPHSWWLIWWDFKNMVQSFLKQKWWTYENWKRDCDKDIAVCPKCGLKNFDID
jgi:hypothetical protein